MDFYNEIENGLEIPFNDDYQELNQFFKENNYTEENFINFNFLIKNVK